MRFPVWRLTSQADRYSAEWLMPEDCQSFDFNGTHCMCYKRRGAETLIRLSPDPGIVYLTLMLLILR
jgi:hypothetical protein